MSRSTIGVGVTGTMIEQGWFSLAAAIIRQACEDYRAAIIYGAPRQKRECERFFRSTYFSNISNIDPDWLMNKLNNKCEVEQIMKQVKPYARTEKLP